MKSDDREKPVVDEELSEALSAAKADLKPGEDAVFYDVARAGLIIEPPGSTAAPDPEAGPRAVKVHVGPKTVPPRTKHETVETEAIKVKRQSEIETERDLDKKNTPKGLGISVLERDTLRDLEKKHDDTLRGLDQKMPGADKAPPSDARVPVVVHGPNSAGCVDPTSAEPLDATAEKSEKKPESAPAPKLDSGEAPTAPISKKPEEIEAAIDPQNADTQKLKLPKAKAQPVDPRKAETLKLNRPKNPPAQPLLEHPEIKALDPQDKPTVPILKDKDGHPLAFAPVRAVESVPPGRSVRKSVLLGILLGVVVFVGAGIWIAKNSGRDHKDVPAQLPSTATTLEPVQTQRGVAIEVVHGKGEPTSSAPETTTAPKPSAMPTRSPKAAGAQSGTSIKQPKDPEQWFDVH